jgi:P pilus assembly chaperone PapD
MTALRLLGRAAAWLVLAVVGLALLGQPGGPLGPPAFAASPLEVTGQVGDLTPGTPGRLTLTVTNPGPVEVVVAELTAQVASGGGEGCGTESLTVAPWTGRLAVPAQAAASVELEVLVVDSPTCAGQTWVLEYAAA